MSRREVDLAEFERLTADLDSELQHSDTLEWSNASLEQSVEDLQEKLRAMDRNQNTMDDDAMEWRTRYDSQVALNGELQQQKDALAEQQNIVRTNIKEVYKIDMMFPEFERYTETELIKLTKQLERQRQDLMSSLKNLQYQIDKESKDFHHFDELRRTYRADIGITNRDLEHLRSVRRLVEKDSPMSPITSPGSLRWNNKDGITSNQRVLDPRRGPVNRAAGVHSLPRVEDKPRGTQRSSPRGSGGPRTDAHELLAAEQRGGNARSLPKMTGKKEAEPTKEPVGRDRESKK